MTSPIDPAIEKQFVILLFKNGNVQSETLNALMYQLTMTTSVPSKKKNENTARHNVNLAEEEAYEIVSGGNDDGQ